MIDSALLVIDVQYGLFHESTPIYKAKTLLDNVLSLVSRAQAAGVPVIYVQHCEEEGLVKDTEAWQLHPRLAPRPTDPLVFKEYGNAFKATPLQEILTARGVNRLVLCGLMTPYCVQSTCLGALALGYPVTLAADAHSTNGEQVAKVIKEWNTKLQAAGAVIKPTVEITFVPAA